MNLEQVTKQRPILFSGPMVKAILDGRKTQTRRVIKPQPAKFWQYAKWQWTDGVSSWWLYDEQCNAGLLGQCRYGSPGDELWVRETWARVNSEAGPGFAYKADSDFIQPEYDGEDFGGGPSFNYEKYPGDYCMWYTDLIGGATSSEGYRWTPSIHMPRWASRITLRITDVRVERVQEISEEDAIAEGIDVEDQPPSPTYKNYTKGQMGRTVYPTHSFRTLWDSINAANGHGWDSNPFCWCVSFERVKP